MTGIGITTRNRRETFLISYKAIKSRAPKGSVIVVVDDASEDPCPYADFRFPLNVGISAAKNKCIELLEGCDDIFLFDDDTFPISSGWEIPYLVSSENHLQYNFLDSANHWPVKETSRKDGIITYDRSRGCMLYVNRKALDAVGGMHNAFGKHGAEHEDWSMRIWEAGLSSSPFQDVEKPMLRCLDSEGIAPSVRYSENQGWRNVDRKSLSPYADYRQRDVPVLVARRRDGGRRDTVWDFLKSRYWELPVFEGFHEEGPFNRSAALNKAAESAGNWDVAVFADSDAYVDRFQLRNAIRLARQTGKAVSPFTWVEEIGRSASEEMTGSFPRFEFGEGEIERVRKEDLYVQSMLLVVPRNVYESAGRFDEGFKGWGGEDNAFWKACETVSGEVLRVEGPAFHVWHEKASRELQPENIRRWERYRKASSLREIREIGEEWTR